MISFQKTMALLKEREISIYQLKREHIIGTATIDKIRQDSGNLDTRSINAMCAYLHCQPGDLMEYIPDEKPEK